MLLPYHIKSALRTILRFKSHTAFSLLGLVMGLACVFIISAWVMEELRYDRFHKRPDHIYMLTTDVKDNTGSIKRYPETPPPLAEALESRIPEVERGFRFLYLYGGRELERDEVVLKEAGVAASPAFLEVFNFPLISGSPADLDDPNSIYLSGKLAEKLFGDASPMGKELRYKGEKILVVKGVFRNVPRNSSLQFDFIIPYEIEYGISDEWWQLSDATFVKIARTADISRVYALMQEIWRERITDDQYGIGMIPITDLRYGADFEFFNAEHGHGNRNKLYMFFGVAVMILLLACLNYMNLVSAYAVKREYEMGIRKIHGAGSKDITNFIVLESILLSVVAWILAALLSMLGLRVFQNLLGIVISPSYFYLCIGFGFLVSILIVGLASGFYPAVKTARALVTDSPGAWNQKFSYRSNLRNALIISQFILSIALVVSSLVILRQASFMRYFETGYSKAGIVNFEMPDQELSEEVRNWLRSRPDVDGYSFAGASPVSLSVLNTTEKWRWEGLGEGEHTSFFRLFVDENYLDVFQIPLIQGRFFTASGRDRNTVVINEKLAALLGFENPVGRILWQGEEAYTITGVVRDFNFQHLKYEIRPLVFMYSGTGRHLFVKISPEAAGSPGEIEKWLSTLSGQPVNYSYVIEEHERLYRGEQQILAAVLIFSILCILLSSLGLIGLVKYETEGRTREIAIRKVVGAGIRDILISLNRTLLKMYLPGVILGCILAWFAMREWLKEFTYRRGFEWWVYLLGATIIFVAAILSVSFQTWQAARRPPATSLKSL